jgi:phosphate transport system substrate-binding protein
MAKVFSDRQPNVTTAVQGGGSEAAITGFISNQATFRRGDAQPRGHLVSNNVSLLAAFRPLTESERQAFHSRYGYEVLKIAIAMDAVAIYVHHQNPIPGLTLEQVDAIFGNDRKRGYQFGLRHWGDVGLQNGWESRPIHLYGRDQRSGTRSFFIETALLGGRITPEVTEAAGSAVEVIDMSHDPLAMGYAGSGFQTSGVRMVPIAPKAGLDFVAPSADSVIGGSYPLARPLYLYARKGPKGLDETTLAFLRFVNSRDDQHAVARAGYYPLSNTQLVQNLKTVNGSYLSAKAVDPSR